MLHYIIDGNNLIGKIKGLKKFRDKKNNSDRERLVFIIDRFFAGRKAKVSLHFDGHPGEAIKSDSAKIIYSYGDKADNLIRDEITRSKSRRQIHLVTSDGSLAQFGKVNSCTVITSENFTRQIETSSAKDEEAEKIKQLAASNERFRELFEKGR